MVSYSQSKGGGSVSRTDPTYKYLPGQEGVAENLVNQFSDIFSGNMANPTARAMQNIVGEAGMRESAQERRRIAETRGMSTPARQRAVAGAGTGAVSTMARVPQEMWQKAAEYLSTYSMQAPAVGQTGISKTDPTKSYGGGICSCENMKALNEGHLMEVIRRFRDEHFSPGSDIDVGYKMMGEWFVPLITGNKWLMKLGRVTLFHPFHFCFQWLYKENLFGFIFLPFIYGWVWGWKLSGRMSGRQFSEKTPRVKRLSYPLMTQTFLRRLMEVI